MFARKRPHQTVQQIANPQKRNYYPLALKLKVRNEFVTGKGSLPQIAARHGINVYCLESWCCADKWTKRRRCFLERLIAKSDQTGELSLSNSTFNFNGTDLASQITKIETHIANIDKAIDEAVSNPRELRDLMFARKLAADQWANYTGFPKPGTRRQTRKGSQAGGPAASEFVPLDQDVAASPTADPTGE